MGRRVVYIFSQNDKTNNSWRCPIRNLEYEGGNFKITAKKKGGGILNAACLSLNKMSMEVGVRNGAPKQESGKRSPMEKWGQG